MAQLEQHWRPGSAALTRAPPLLLLQPLAQEAGERRQAVQLPRAHADRGGGHALLHRLAQPAGRGPGETGEPIAPVDRASRRVGARPRRC